MCGSQEGVVASFESTSFPVRGATGRPDQVHVWLPTRIEARVRRWPVLASAIRGRSESVRPLANVSVKPAWQWPDRRALDG